MVYVRKQPTYEELENTIRILHTENLKLHYELQNLQASDGKSKLDLADDNISTKQLKSRFQQRLEEMEQKRKGAGC